MVESDKRKFHEIIGAILQVHGRPANTAVLQIWWGALAPWPFDQVKDALETFIRDGGNPVPASIVHLLPDILGHPSPEEAWNVAQKDEYHECGYMSGEMLSAVCAASDSIERGDMIGARRCFIDVYKEKVTEARREGRKPAFSYFPALAATEGQKYQNEAAATRDAEVKGWISGQTAENTLMRLGQLSENLPQRSGNKALIHANANRLTRKTEIQG